MITTSIFPSRYIQGPHAMSALGTELARFGPRALLVVSPTILDNILPAYRADIDSAIEVKVERFGRESSDEEIERIAEIARSSCWAI